MVVDAEMNEEEHYKCDTKGQTKKKEKLGENPCFPGSALVDVLKKDGKECRVSMKDLGIGDLVKTIDVSTKEVKFTPVMIFAHHNVESFSTFFKLKLEDGKKIVLSGNHLIFVGPNGKTKMARYVCINDLLNLASGGMSKVANIEEIKEKVMVALDEIRPFLASDGGDISLVAIENDKKVKV